MSYKFDNHAFFLLKANWSFLVSAVSNIVGINGRMQECGEEKG